MRLALQGSQDIANKSWSAFHANTETNNAEETREIPQLTTFCLLPLCQEEAATVSVMQHSLDVIRNVLELIYPGQVPVVGMDHCIGKKHPMEMA